MVAAIGAGLPVTDTEASMVVDIGGGSTDVAVIALGGIVASRSTRVAGDALDDAIVDHVRRHLSLLLGERSAEHIKIEVGSAFPLAREVSTRVRGRDLVRERYDWAKGATAFVGALTDVAAERSPRR